MGIGAEAMKLYAELADDPAFQRGKTVCELGSQDMQCEGHWWKPARDYYMQDLGMTYVCIDIDGRHGALKLDLNVASRAEVGCAFDVVTNHGTTEHCFNQHNCFKLMHDITKVGGLMIHIVPSNPWDYQDDSFFYYSLQLFDDLADANEYERVRLEYIDGAHGKMVQVVLRRTAENSFQMPIQKHYQLREGMVLTPPTAHLGIREK